MSDFDDLCVADMVKVEELVRTIEADGLRWAACESHNGVYIYCCVNL